MPEFDDAKRRYADAQGAEAVAKLAYLRAVEEKGIGPDHIRAELGEVLVGSHEGRRSDDELTVFVSLGLAVEDLAAAEYLYQRGRNEGAGAAVPF